MAEKDKELIENIEKQEYKYGFTSDIETETIPRGLNEEVVRLISTKKGEINRKMLSEMAINDPVAFTKLVEIAKNA